GKTKGRVRTADGFRRALGYHPRSVWQQRAQTMSQTPMYVAFPASDALRERIDAFLKAAADRPTESHVDTLGQIIDPFLDEVLHAYFTGPIDAVHAKGAAVNVILGAMK